MWSWYSSSVTDVSPFTQVPSDRASWSIVWMNVKPLFHSKLSPQNVALLCAARTTTHPRLDHSQLVWTTYIGKYFPSRSHFASSCGECLHSSPLVTWPQGGQSFDTVVWKCLYTNPCHQTHHLCHSHLAKEEVQRCRIPRFLEGPLLRVLLVFLVGGLLQFAVICCRIKGYSRRVV